MINKSDYIAMPHVYGHYRHKDAKYVIDGILYEECGHREDGPALMYHIHFSGYRLWYRWLYWDVSSILAGRGLHEYQ